MESVADIPSARPATGAWWRWLYLPVGCVLVVLAAVGLLVPVLPTTPLLLLASACFIRSSPRAQAWLLRSRLFGPAIHQWQTRRAVHPWVKVVAVVAIAAAVGLVLTRPFHWVLQAVTVVLCVIGLVVVLRLPVIGRGG